jgi:uncharacterized protein (TIGR00725 family)
MSSTPSRSRAAYVGVVGPADATAAQCDEAREVGRRLARAGAVVVCGGLGGVMHAAADGSAEVGGVSIGLLPGVDRAAASPRLTVAIATGLGEARNALVVRASDALIAIAGGFGTLSEIGLALKLGRPVIGLATWDLGRSEGPAPILAATDPADAVARAVALALAPR